MVAPELTLTAGVTPTDHAHELAAAVAASAGVAPAGVAPLVVAGHSYGGLVAPVVEMLEAAALVVIDGLVPDDGESAADIHPDRIAGASGGGRRARRPEVDRGAGPLGAGVAGLVRAPGADADLGVRGPGPPPDAAAGVRR